MEVKKKENKASSKLKKLVYASLAGAMVGVTCTAASAHGNASSHEKLKFNWDDVSVQSTDVDTKTKVNSLIK